MISQTDIFKSRGYNVPTFVFDAEGKKVEIETREDDEQRLTYENIISKLVAAGYYRAGIRGINPFDVIVGGMTWCIDDRDIDLDVDLLFKESLTIGQKIALTEKIVVVLPKIKCPYFIEPHQIQGLDFIHIYPVILWLIQWSDENRRKKADYLRSYALNQYYKRFSDPQSERLNNLKTKALKNIKFVTDKYQVRRICKQADASISNLLLQVEGTLAEYGLSTYKKNAGFVIGSISSREKHFQTDEIKALFGGLSLADYSPEKLNFENTEHLLNSKLYVKNPEIKIKRLEIERSALLKEKERLDDALAEITKEPVELANENDQKNTDLDNLAAEEKKAIKEIQILIQKHDKVKEEEKAFKESCKSELIELETEIAELTASEGDEETEELRVQLKHLQGELEMKKQELGIKTRGLSANERIMDEIPSRAELSQYQKRFLELYNQVALKHTETKRYYILFNTINEKYHYMEKEFNILNSIQDSYTQVVTSSENRDEFIQQLNGIVAGIHQAKGKTMQKRNENKRKQEILIDHLLYLQEQKSDYICAVKELSDECKKNEQLLAKLKRLRSLKN